MKLLSVGINKSHSDDLSSFSSLVGEIVRLWIKKSDIIVFPEYCWGNAEAEEVIDKIKEILAEIDNNNLIVFGTLPIAIEGRLNNCAIIANGPELSFLPKEHVLEGERKRGVVSGKNTGVVNFKGISVGILICADLWDGKLVKKIVDEQGAKILLIPAFTVVSVGMSNYAKQLWYSLGISRSREFVVPLMIADHLLGSDEFDVGSATSIIDPSKKSLNMNTQADFIEIPTQDNLVYYEIDLKELEEYRKYRIKEGLKPT